MLDLPEVYEYSGLGVRNHRNTQYFCFGNSAAVLDKIRKYAAMRIALFVGKQHKRDRSWGFAAVYRSPVSLGLVSLNGIVVAPRPNRPWRAPVERRR